MAKSHCFSSKTLKHFELATGRHIGKGLGEKFAEKNPNSHGIYTATCFAKWCKKIAVSQMSEGKDATALV